MNKDKPYRRCHLEISVDVSGHKFLKDSDVPKVVYNINIETFPSDDGLTGAGEIIWPSGIRYFGQIKSGLPFGKGAVYFSKEWPVSSYVGEFSNTASKSYSTAKYWPGQFDSLFPGLINDLSSENPDGSRDEYSLFLMEFSLTLINGQGELKYRNGKEIIGFFENGIQQENKNSKNEKLADIMDSRRRFALVIGNSNYGSLPKLPNAVNDARVITQSLRSAGFQVSMHENLDLTGMQNAIRVFGEKLGKSDVGLVYYAGHGVQVKGKNYLIPVKENIKKSFEVPSSAVDVDLVLATLENIKNDLNIVVLDACRSSFPGEARGTNRGLATIEAAKGTFIAFATAPGKEALDGSGSNSPYTKHLAKLIGKKGLPLEQVFKEVRKAVVAETNGEQVPWENSSLMGDFYFQK